MHSVSVVMTVTKKRAHSERPPFALVNIFCHRWQHFFATKKGWGLDPWGYLQNPFHILRVRHSYAYFETTIFQICSAVFPKKCHLSILAFHKYYIIDRFNFLNQAVKVNDELSQLSEI